MPKIAVCIATFKRPRLLMDLLHSMARQESPEDEHAKVRLIVVDNDPSGSAREAFELCQEALPWPAEYVVEPGRGISRARNRAVHCALARNADFVVFIDDDEVATPAWLRTLLSVQRRYSADVVQGPVVPRYELGTPDWIIRGGFFVRPRYPTGTELELGACGNTLIARKWLEASAEPFDPEFGLTGAEDTHFFMRARRSGAKLIWADEAIVHEVVPSSRANPVWILKRTFRGGTTFVKVNLALEASKTWVVSRAVRACGRIAQGILLLLPSLVLGQAAMLRATQKIVAGIGQLSGFVGIRYNEYKTTHGQ